VKAKIPVRLWCAVLLNIVVNVAGQFAFWYLFFTNGWPAFVAPIKPYNIVIALCISLFLYVSCVMALLGKPRWREILLAVVLITYGINLFQVVHLLYLNYGTLNDHEHAQFYFDISIKVFELVFNVWALESTTTREFFSMKAKQRASLKLSLRQNEAGFTS
jgi:hypothetical protein